MDLDLISGTDEGIKLAGAKIEATALKQLATLGGRDPVGSFSKSVMIP